MIAYEVNLELEPSVSAKFQEFMHEHIAEMLKIRGFIKAEYFNVRPDPQYVGRQRQVVQYYLNSPTDLDRYLNEDAEKMRRPGLEKFPNQFTATRRILTFTE